LPDSPEESHSPSPTRRSRVSTSAGSDGRTVGGLSRRFVDVLGWTITGAWAASFALDAMVVGYEPPVTVHALMMIVAGAAFGSSLFQRNGNGNGSGGDQ
jgi:hypothetical protein